MTWNVVHPAGLPKPVAPYSMGSQVRSGLIFTAGIVSIDSEGKTVGVGDARLQTRTVLQSIGAILAAAGAGFADVVQVQIFIKDFNDYAGVNEVYKEFFKPAYPPRYCVRADLVKPDWLVEIAVVAQGR